CGLVVCLVVDVRPVIEQELGQIAVIIDDGQQQSGLPALATDVYIRLPLQEETGNVAAPEIRGDVQGGPAGVSRGIDLRAVLQQQLDEFLVSVAVGSDRQVKRGSCDWNLVGITAKPVGQ